MESALGRFLMWVGFLCVVSVFGLFAAFPFKWCWNYGMTYAFKLPEIGWGHAYCLTWVLAYLKTSVVTHEAHDKK